MASLDEKRSSTANHGSIEKTNDFQDLARYIEEGEINELAVIAEGEERTTWFVWILVLCSTISGLLFGV